MQMKHPSFLPVLLFTIQRLVWGQVVAIEAHFPECSATIELPYLHSLPDDVNFCPDGRNLMHDRFGEGIAYAYVIVFFKSHYEVILPVSIY